ncbi:PadR family transcriptional regulator [Thalassotalea euphylliae]|uniref:PadR family transcriptional regulator n=1 Tax=Thalassotalea euphylliae TaxID=1655234 RepID=A0A3E0UDV2_9GAMM|nr:PadR family transcriptional regulator [Thalassotalea euphylliae]REL35076.1 PadR family transcriptional regulator [Thalassotalea euphylliae]
MANGEKFLGEFEQMAMLALIHLGSEAYGAAIRQLLAEQVDRSVAIGALYSTLDRLERKGMVASRLGEATAQRGGRPKRYFTVTAQGNSALLRARKAMDTLWQGVSIGQVDLLGAQ